MARVEKPGPFLFLVVLDRKAVGPLELPSMRH
jgi:hypothetical protein